MRRKITLSSPPSMVYLTILFLSFLVPRLSAESSYQQPMR